MSQSNPFGDMMHLLCFRHNPASYTILLKAVLEVITERETLMPITPADVFQRHHFLGGKQRVINARSENPVTAEELRHIYRMPWSTNADEALSRRLLRDFFSFMVVKGDAVKEPAILATGDEIEGFVLMARQNRYNPPVGGLRFYHSSKLESFKKGDASAIDIYKLTAELRNLLRGKTEEERIKIVWDGLQKYYGVSKTQLLGRHRAYVVLRARKMITYILAVSINLPREKAAAVFKNKKANVISVLKNFTEDLKDTPSLREELADILSELVSGLKEDQTDT